MAKDDPNMPEEAAALTRESKEAIEPPATSDIGGEHIPAPGDVVVPSDKINELMSEKKSACRGRPPKADRAEQAPAPEKTDAEKSHPAPKKERKPRAEKQKPAAAKKPRRKRKSPPRSRNRRRSLPARAKRSRSFS
jgi:hypothetical protein